MYRPQEADLVRRWLAHSDTLIGSNLQYDVLMMRASDQRLRVLLDGRRHLLIDLTILSFLHSEMRDSHSLKALGHSLGTHSYDEEPDEGDTYKRYDSVDDSGLLSYAAQDSHNVIVDAAEMARRILRDYPGTHKLSAFCLQFYSDTIWSCVRMSEAGVPMDALRLLRLERHLQARIIRCVSLAASQGLLLEGEDSEKSKQAFITRLIQEIDSCAVPSPSSSCSSGLSSSPSSSLSSSSSVLDHPLLVKTEKKKQVSFCIENRNLFLSLLNRLPSTAGCASPAPTSATEPGSTSPTPTPPSSRAELISCLKVAQTHSKLSKLVNTYTFPLLHHTKGKPLQQRSRLIPPFNQWTPLQPHQRETLLSGSSGTLFSRACPCCSPTSPSPPSGSPPSAPASSPSGPGGGATSHGWKGVGLIHFSYPTWFITPTAQKDDSGARGGTKQGRITCKNHAHQTDPPIIQRAIRSRFGEAGSIIKIDASQIELRVPGVLSGEPVIIEEYNKPNPDLHTWMAIRIFGEPHLIDKYGPDWRGVKAYRKDSNGERQVGKHTNFGNVYRASAETMHGVVLEMTGLNLRLSIFENIVAQRPTLWPVYWEWQERLLEIAEKHGYLEIPFTGQTRRFDGFTRKPRRRGDDSIKNMANEIVNFPIQTFAGDVMLEIQHELHQRLPSMNNDSAPCFMFLNIYDALFFDCHNSYRPRLEEHIAASVNAVATSGLWGMTERLTGHHVPLICELSEHH